MNNKKNAAIFPGTFEVFHAGHIDILKKALKLFKKVYVVVSNNPEKDEKTLEQRFLRTKIVLQQLKLANVEIVKNEGRTLDIANKLDCYYIIRGVRSNFDLEYEIKLYDSYKEINHNFETILLISDYEFRKLSSTRILRSLKNEK